MTVAQTKARRQFWAKQDGRYRKSKKDPEAARRKQAETLQRERERQQRAKGKKK